MTTTMRRQLERLQLELDAIKPKPPRTIRLVAKPGPDATYAQREAYAEALTWSKKQDGNGVSLIVLTPLEPIRREVVGSVMFIGNEVEAHLTALALQPSEIGNATRLDDVLKGLSGNVIGAKCSAEMSGG